jgi:hypothetical protein
MTKCKNSSICTFAIMNIPFSAPVCTLEMLKVNIIVESEEPRKPHSCKNCVEFLHSRPQMIS